ncbi:MAG: hypothetical protein ACI8QT_000790 [Halioglobus sp.]|jgi:hypothetical protein
MPLTAQITLFILALTMLDAGPAWAAKKNPEGDAAAQFGAEISIGGEYDDNVTVDEVDLSSSQGDYALNVSAKVEANTSLSKATDLDLSYNYSQSKYNEFSQVDRQTHILGSNFEVDMGKVNSGLSLFYIDSRLDGSKFLKLYRASPSLSGFVAKKWFARGAYVYSDKIIEERSQRDATSNAGEFDVYYFRRGLRSYFNVGIQYKDEDADAVEFDYIAANFKVRYVHRFHLFSKNSVLELAFRYEDRQYSSPTPSIEEKRSDERQRWRIDLEIPVIERGAIEFYGAYSDYSSNLPRADYTQKIIGTRFVYTW